MNESNDKSNLIAKFLEQIIIQVNLKRELEETLCSRHCQRCEEPRHVEDFTNNLGVCDVCYDQLSIDEQLMLINNLCEGK